MRYALTAVGFLLIVVAIVMLITGPADGALFYVVALLLGLALSAAGLLAPEHGRRRSHRHGRRRGPPVH